ncbi:MAG: hypothetical protein JWO04_576 [Gammaproteobacteria bacterium]|jgi:hypothetical protein|nr:hypothetical protein [Gammaproteobacteria bacterium]
MTAIPGIDPMIALIMLAEVGGSDDVLFTAA